MSANGLKILIIDDSSTAIGVAAAHLKSAGHEVDSLTDPELALIRLRELQPDVLVCDIMMPGISGFEVLRRIREDGQFGDLRIVMASAKAYEADRNKAKKLGAHGYIVKPFTIEKFESVMDSLETMQLTAWGVRGTLPVPQEGYIRFGGNTSCYSLQFAPDRHLIFDSGTGIKNLGTALMKSGQARITADLLITHPHWDHINAFPFFTPIYVPGHSIRVYGARQDDYGFEELILNQMDGTYFPVTAREFGAQVTFHEISEQELDLDGIAVRTMLLKHPGHCLGYRVDHNGRSFCYITDNELYPEDSEFADEEFLLSLADFCRGANVLVHDCTYFDEEYASKEHWGHSPLSQVCRLAHLAEAERLWIHHHDPDQSDEDIERKLEVCTTTLQALGSETRAVLPHEGLSEKV